MADKTFQVEQERLVADEKRREEKGMSREDEERQSLIAAADEAEKDADASTRSMFSSPKSHHANNNTASETVAATSTTDRNSRNSDRNSNSRAANLESETRNRALKEAAQAEERRNLAELKAAQMDALAKQVEKEEAEMEEEIAKQELEARAHEEEAMEKELAERAKIELSMKEREASLAALQAEQEADMVGKMAQAKKKLQADQAAKKKAAEELTAPTFSLDDANFPPITPIAPKGSQQANLETPSTLFKVEDDLNIEDMLGNMNIDLDTTATRNVAVPADFQTPAGKKLGDETLARDSGVTRELAGIDDLMAGLDMAAFSIDDSYSSSTSTAAANSSAAQASRDGGLKLQEDIKQEDYDVDALSSLDFGATTAAKHIQAGDRHNFSEASIIHETAKEVASAGEINLGPAASAVPTSPGRGNVFDDFTLDTLDVKGMDGSDLLNVDIDFNAIGAGDQAAAKVKADAEAKVKAQAEADAKKKAEADAEAKAKAEAEAKAAQEKKSEIRQDEKSGTTFGNKAAMFEQMASPDAKPAPKATGGGAKKNNKKKNNKKKKTK